MTAKKAAKAQGGMKATLSAKFAKHATLTAATVDTVTLSGYSQANVEVKNRGSADIYFTVDGSVPTVGGDDCYIVQPGEGLKVGVSIATSTVVKLISSGATAYSVTGS